MRSEGDVDHQISILGSHVVQDKEARASHLVGFCAKTCTRYNLIKLCHLSVCEYEYFGQTLKLTNEQKQMRNRQELNEKGCDSKEEEQNFAPSNDKTERKKCCYIDSKK